MSKPVPPQHHRFSEMWQPEPNTGCFLWLGFCDGNGYGAVMVNGKFKGAHRVAYERAIGPIHEGLTVDHMCRTRSCVNPDHLQLLTLEDNASEGARRLKELGRVGRGQWGKYPDYASWKARSKVS